MLEVILDTETTGLSNAEKHRIVEIGCIELNNQISTNNIFHEYINPQRPVSEEAFKIWHNILPKIDNETIKLLEGQIPSLTSVGSKF